VNVEKRISFWALIATAMALGVLFFRVVQPFLAPLLIAAVLALLAYPLQLRMSGALGGRRRAAACVAAGIVLVLLALIAVLLMITGRELVEAGRQLAATNPEDQPALHRLNELVRAWFPGLEWDDLRTTFLGAVESGTQTILQRTQQYLADLVAFAIGLAVMGLALYYFLAEGNQMLRNLHRLSPLESGDEEVLFDKFARVCRGLVLGTLLCAVAQAVLMGLGLWAAGVERVWALAGLTLVCSMIPIIGSGGVWVPVSLWLVWEGRFGAGLFMMLYGALIVATADNLVRAYVLQGSASMHPLLALVSALGGMQLFGLWGIFVGPVVAALFSTLIRVVHDRLDAEIKKSELGELRG
jgi:predicted PurR-regulated permease PerM